MRTLDAVYEAGNAAVVVLAHDAAYVATATGLTGYSCGVGEGRV